MDGGKASGKGGVRSGRQPFDSFRADCSCASGPSEEGGVGGVGVVGGVGALGVVGGVSYGGSERSTRAEIRKLREGGRGEGPAANTICTAPLGSRPSASSQEGRGRGGKGGRLQASLIEAGGGADAAEGKGKGGKAARKERVQAGKGAKGGELGSSELEAVPLGGRGRGKGKGKDGVEEVGGKGGGGRAVGRGSGGAKGVQAVEGGEGGLLDGSGEKKPSRRQLERERRKEREVRRRERQQRPSGGTSDSEENDAPPLLLGRREAASDEEEYVPSSFPNVSGILANANLSADLARDMGAAVSKPTVSKLAAKKGDAGVAASVEGEEPREMPQLLGITCISATEIKVEIKLDGIFKRAEPPPPPHLNHHPSTQHAKQSSKGDARAPGARPPKPQVKEMTIGLRPFGTAVQPAAARAAQPPLWTAAPSNPTTPSHGPTSFGAFGGSSRFGPLFSPPTAPQHAGGAIPF
ncbi:MAG: hypothetical protein SGPRY_005769 [Prymnesium sp.]